MMAVATKMSTGAWSARWGEWQIYLRSQTNGWTVIVWRWANGAPAHTRVLLGKATAHDTSKAAITWACDVLKQDGAQVFINGSERSLADFLSFSPAPEAMP